MTLYPATSCMCDFASLWRACNTCMLFEPSNEPDDCTWHRILTVHGEGHLQGLALTCGCGS
jgi:hypothetical protein